MLFEDLTQSIILGHSELKNDIATMPKAGFVMKDIRCKYRYQTSPFILEMNQDVESFRSHLL